MSMLNFVLLTWNLLHRLNLLRCLHLHELVIMHTHFPRMYLHIPHVHAQVHTVRVHTVRNFNVCDAAEDQIREMSGPGTQEQWLYWRSKTPEQRQRCAVMKELSKLVENTV